MRKGEKSDLQMLPASALASLPGWRIAPEQSCSHLCWGLGRLLCVGQLPCGIWPVAASMQLVPHCSPRQHAAGIADVPAAGTGHAPERGLPRLSQRGTALRKQLPG